MRYFKILLLTVGSLFLLTGVGLAKQETKQFQIGDDLFIAGDSVVIDQDIAGDLYAAGGSVRIKANVAGDVMVAGGIITIDGNVGGALRAGGQQLNINGSVGGLVLAGGTNVNLNAGEGATANNVMVGGEAVSIDRPVSGDLAAGAMFFTLDKEVAGDAHLALDDAASFDESKVLGQISYVDRNTYRTPSNQFYGSGFLPTLYLALTVVLVGVFAYLFFPGSTTELVMVQRKQTWLVVIFGILAIPLAVAIAFLFLVSGALALLAVLLVMVAPAAFVLGVASVYQNLGQVITKARGERRGWGIVIGGVAFVILGLIPVVNALAGLVATILGLGSITVVLLQRVKALPKLT